MFRQRRDQDKAFFGVSFHKTLDHSIVVNGPFVLNVYQSQARQSFRCHSGAQISFDKLACVASENQALKVPRRGNPTWGPSGDCEIFGPRRGDFWHSEAK